MNWNGFAYAIWSHNADGWLFATPGRRLGRMFYSQEAGERGFEAALQSVGGCQELALLEIDCMGHRPDVVVVEATTLPTPEQRAAMARLTVSWPPATG